MWTKVVNSIEHSGVFDTKFLFGIQELVVAGFRSRHKAVVNESIAMWNNTFGVEASLEYPKDLKTILQKLRSLTELRLPDFPERNGEEVSRPYLAAEIATADVPRSYLRLSISSTPKLKKRCNWSLSCPLFDLLLQLIHCKALQILSKACGSVHIQERLQRSESHQLQHDGESRLLQRHASDTRIPKSNSLPLNHHLCNLSQSTHSI